MKNKRAGVRLALAGLVALSLLVLIAIPAYAQQNITVSIEDYILSKGETKNIPIMITNDTAQAVSSATINLTYDKSVVEVIAAGNSDFNVFTPNIIDGKVWMIGFQTTSLTTPIKFADVTIKAIGNPGDCTPLNLEIVELNMATGSPIYPRDVSNGSVCITVPAPEYNIFGLSVLIGLLAIVLAISIKAKKK